MKITGIIFIILGFFLWFGGVRFETSTYSALLDKVSNIGLLQAQMIMVYTGLILFLSGVILMGFGIIYESLKKELKSIESKLQKEEVK